MTPHSQPVRKQGHKPALRDVMKPAEFIGLSVAMGLFAGLTVLLSTRQVILSLIFFGVAFIAALVVLALFALEFNPEKDQRQVPVLQRHEADIDGRDFDAPADVAGTATGTAGGAASGGTASDPGGDDEPPRRPAAD